jgi:hypothetical protein
MAKRTSEGRSQKTLERAEMIRQEEGGIPFPDRNSKEGIAERREHVWKFMSRRVPQTVMAELLGVSRRTIYEDVQWWRERCKEHVTRIQEDPDYAATDIGLTALRLEGIAQAAMNDYELARTGQLKNLCLNTAIKAEKTRADMMMAAGVWPKAGEDIRINHQVEASFTAKLGSVDEDSPLNVLEQPASRRKVMGAAELILKLAASKQSKKDKNETVIDVTPTPKSGDA